MKLIETNNLTGGIFLSKMSPMVCAVSSGAWISRPRVLCSSVIGPVSRKAIKYKKQGLPGVGRQLDRASAT